MTVIDQLAALALLQAAALSARFRIAPDASSFGSQTARET
jgi:hypothetical protein